jgi:penicillin amidase
MKRLLKVTAVLLIVLSAVSLFALQRVRRGPGLPTGERSLAGLDAPVEILWDEFGIPQLWAASERDALFAQGYLHATHRLWQVELFRRVASGRLSEIFAEATLADDRFLRTLGMDRAARASERLLGEGERALLQAYADGINAAVAGWRGPLPPEFLVLGIEPEPYTLTDVLALEKIMAFDLSGYGESLGMARLYAALGPEAAAELAPSYPAGGLTILESAGMEEAPAEPWLRGLSPGGGAMAAGREGASRAVAVALNGRDDIPAPWGGPWGPDSAGGTADADRLRLVESALRPSALTVQSPDGPLFDFVAAVNAVHASNSWVLGPERSESGKPLLANDMHLALNRPTIWYLMGIHAPGLDVVGMSLPGTAGIVAGRTDAVAWGFTNAMLDDMDLFVERVDPDDPGRYLTPGGSEPFQERVEEIRIRGGQVDTLVVRTTRHGPVVTPVADGVGDELLSLRWVGHDPSRTPAALLGMNRAGSAEAFLRALRDFTDPHQNVVFADTAGTWGYWMAGRIPLRPGGAPEPGPVPGWTGDHDWEGYLDFDAHPHAVNPPSGFVATGNNRQGRSPDANRISRQWQPPYRAQRIADLIQARPLHDPASLHAIQLDVVTLEGRAFAAEAARSFRAAGSDSAAALVEGWDGAATRESVPAALFQRWYAELERLYRARSAGDEDAFLPYNQVVRALRAGLDPEVGTEAARRALVQVDFRPLSEVRTLRLDHPLSAVPLLQRLFGFALEEIAVAGTGSTVAPALSRGAPGTDVLTWGASQRHVSDMADLDAGGFVLPGGQSGYPASPHAADQLPLWLEGGLIPVPMRRASVEARAGARLTLLPG